MLSDITLGQFFPGNSLLHRLDPRMKIILTILYIAAVFVARDVFCFLLVTIVTLALLFASRISPRVLLKGLKPLIFVLIFTLILNLFRKGAEGEEPLLAFWRLRIYPSGILYAALSSLRVILLVIGTSLLLTYTSSPMALANALESLLSPLKVIHVPVHDFAMVMTIALRFIPTLIEETDKIINAQKARGADFASGGIIKRARALLPVLVPLFVSAFRRADDLAIAMECRCYRNGEGATRLVKLTCRAADYLMLCAAVLLLALVILGNRYVPVLLPFTVGI